MRVLLASKALVVGAYQQKLHDLARHPAVSHLTAVVPPAWQEPGGRMLAFEPDFTSGYDLRIEPIRFNGNFHLFFWPGLGRIIRETRPDLVHLDEEPYNFATAHGAWAARRSGARLVFFSWQNLARRYPPPFGQMEQFVYHVSDGALVGNAEAGAVLREKGYRHPTFHVPQFGVDSDRFAPLAGGPLPSGGTFQVGFAGRVVEEKGILVLLRALGRLEGSWQLTVMGSGPLLGRCQRETRERGIADRVRWDPGVPSLDMPARLQALDALVLPSLTRPNWKEQFGRVLVEAMACQVPVVASASGEIPNVVGDAGLLVPEGDENALQAALARLRDDAMLRRSLGERGRARVLARFTHQRIVEQTVSAYQQVFASPRGTANR